MGGLVAGKARTCGCDRRNIAVGLERQHFEQLSCGVARFAAQPFVGGRSPDAGPLHPPQPRPPAPWGQARKGQARAPGGARPAAPPRARLPLRRGRPWPRRDACRPAPAPGLPASPTLGLQRLQRLPLAQLQSIDQARAAWWYLSDMCLRQQQASSRVWACLLAAQRARFPRPACSAVPAHAHAPSQGAPPAAAFGPYLPQ